ETAYRQLAAGERPVLPAKTTAWKSWAERLAAHARSAEVRAELGFWTALAGAPPLPVDLPGGDNRVGSAATVTIELPAAATLALLRQAPAAYRTGVDELLLTALARVLARATGGERVLLDVEGHGREEAIADTGAGAVDLSRTVGWFTTLFPVALDLDGTADLGAAIKAVKEQLRAIPDRGLGYSLLRWLGDPAAQARLAARPAPEVIFNYLGQADPVLAEAALLTPAAEVTRGGESPRAPRGHLLDVSGLVLGDRLRLDFTYSAALHRPPTIEALAQGFLAELQALIDYCLAPAAGGYTPSDFPLARLGQGELDSLLGGERGIEDLYPLAPLQQGILFHTLYSPGSELYFEQLTATLVGPLDLAAFTGAWQRVTDRHPALRAAFLWAGLDAPLQAIHREVPLEWQLFDWAALEITAEERERRWSALQAADRRRGFDLARPPLLRLTLLRTAPGEHRLLWSFHHLLVDGWCFSLLFSEVFALYAALVQGREPAVAISAPAHPYRDYIAWLGRRDAAAAEGFWRCALAGFAAPTPLPYDHPAAGGGLAAADYREQEIALGAAAVAALTGLAQRLGVTPNVLLQAAWALLLSRFAREADVVFGTVVSGRPADLPGVESIVGLFINTVPVRATIPAVPAVPAAPAVPAVPDSPLAAWLGRLQAAQAERSQSEWTPLARIQAASEVPVGEPLFDSLLVFENYPLDPGLAAGVSGLAIADVSVSERTHYGLTLAAAARGGDLILRLLHDRRFEPVTARRLLGHLAVLLAGFAADPERAPAEFPLLAAAERHQLLVEWPDTESEEVAGALPVHESFRARAAASPEALAVVAEDGRLTYGELDRRAERLALRLLSLGVGRESVVGLAVGRS
ncbi:MAG TPA: condensation domain-containing protein, partial [Thermoanaerobaculia bacterium]|nr:condensation domain-containing protein [Thermoanaerobaculia bacterium]